MTDPNPVPAGQSVDSACLKPTDDKENATTDVENRLSNTSVKYFEVRCSTSFDSRSSFYKRRISLGYDASLSVVTDDGG
jgi:hypothetical protein